MFLGTTLLYFCDQSGHVYVRVKNVNGRRYAYLVAGRRDGNGRVRQKTLCYLGSVSRLASAGVSGEVREKARPLGVDWEKVNGEIRRIPLTFEELSEARRVRFVLDVKERRNRFLTQGDRRRAEGELRALAKAAESRFREMFEEVGERAYCMT